MRVQVLPNGDFVANAVPVIMLLSYAYDVPVNPSSRLSPLPDWTARERYDIEAKAPPNTIIPGLQDNEARSRIQQMMRRLLANRSRFAMRVEHGALGAFALPVFASGPKLQRSAVTAKDCIFDTAPEGCHKPVIGFGHPLDANAISMDDLTHYIENWTALPVVDRTHLSGLFTVHTEGWLPMRMPPPPPNGNANTNFAALPTIFTVLGKLGLELHRREEILRSTPLNGSSAHPSRDLECFPGDDHGACGSGGGDTSGIMVRRR